MSKRAKIHSLQNAPKPFLSTPKGSADVFAPFAKEAECFSRHTELDSQWCYSVWMAKMRYGMIHFQVDGVGEIWLMPGDLWFDVLYSFGNLKKESEL